MNYKKNLIMCLGLTLGVIGLAATSSAAPILSGSLPLADGTSIKGISNLKSNVVSGDPVLQIDWVVSLSSGIYTYEYQIENTTGVDIENFSVSASNVISASSDSTNLDLTHVLGGTDTELATGGIDGSVTTTAFNSNQVSWSWGLNDALSDNMQSSRLFYTSAIGPSFGFGTVQDSTLNWAVSNPGSDNLPVPTPEPTTFLGGALGLAAVALYARRRKKQG